MYLFVYKTSHPNGEYYIGRHETENLNDGYLGSGSWIRNIKEKLILNREILVEANSIVELKQLEEYYIDLHWDDPLCMNKIKSSDGFTSEDAKQIAKKQVEEGTHPFLTKPDGTNIQTDRVKKGIHNFQKRKDGTSLTSERVKKGTHNFLTRPDGTNINTDRIDDGSHHLLKRPDGSSIVGDQVKNGTHNFLKKPDGTSIGGETSKRRSRDGTNNFFKNKGLVPCYNNTGEYLRIPKDTYYTQTGPKENWEFVHSSSKEARKRKLNKN